MSVEAKREELKAIRDQIEQIDPSSAAYGELKRQEEALEAEISELKTAAQQSAIEEKVQGEAVHIAIEGVEFDQLPTSLITVIDKVVKADRKLHFTQHAIEIEQIETAAAEREAEFKRKNEELQQKLAAVEEKHGEMIALNDHLKSENIRLRGERDEAYQLRDNAAAELTETLNENNRLQSLVDDYQKAKVFGEREAQNIITVDAGVAEDINQAIKYFLSAEDWGSVLKAYKPDGTFELVKRADFEAEWQRFAPPALFDGGSDTQESFRGEDTEADNSDREDAAEIPAFEGVTFQSEESAAELAGDAVVREDDAQEAISRAEFEALKERVAKLEQGEVKEAA